jgi:selenocysteine lyase/cysteine desulfurase
MIDEMRGYIAKQVNCKKKNIFITQNATDAFNSLMKSLEWKEGDIVLLPNIAYAAIRQTMNWIRDRYKIVIQDVIFI